MAWQNDQHWQATKKTVLERNCHMFNNPLMSDIAFTCGQSKRKFFYAHKYVLATSSAVFYAMFYGYLPETNSVIHLPDADEESFEEFLRFLYIDQCKLTPENAIRIMYLAKKYMITSLTQKCTEVVENSIFPENAFTVLEQAIQFDEKELERKCWNIIDSQTDKVVTSDYFIYISKRTLEMLLKRDPLNIKEIDLFKAVLKWSDHECWKNGLEATGKNRRAILGDAVYQIRFLSMSEKEFTECVSSSELLTADEMIPIYQKFNGLDTPALECTPFNRQGRRENLERIRFARFSPTDVECRYIYGPSTLELNDAISFSVSERAKLHGVRLLGGAEDGKRKVTLEVDGVKVTGSYASENVQNCGYGFDVMLPSPTVVDQNEVVTMAARVETKGYYSCGNNGKRSVEVEGITVSFISVPPSSVYASSPGTTKGLFQEVILTRCNCGSKLKNS